MGPRSENRGYGSGGILSLRRAKWLQWVHGLRTVVMPAAPVNPNEQAKELQWVHGLRTVVMAQGPLRLNFC